ncbi:hypothetical protein [Nisaea sediminum]|uniref:hypothetical protein n=1 Tax=Nisaea sediminum TaxID=2775867 RepID=UPI001866C901|nr:hypothetical protein [Nisaea sediminum]
MIEFIGRRSDVMMPEISTPRADLDKLYLDLTQSNIPYVPTNDAAYEQYQPKIYLQNELQVQAFVEQALTLLSPEDAKKFGAQSVPAGDQLGAYLQELFEAVKPKVDIAFIRATFDRFIDKAYKDAFQAFAASVDKSANGTQFKGSVVFVARNSFNVIQREALYLRRNGYKVTLLNLNPIGDSLKPFFNEAFHIVFDSIGSYHTLGKLLPLLKPDIFHVQCLMHEYFMARFINENKTTGKLVCEFYDITSVFAPTDILKKIYWPAGIDLDVEMERYIFNHADAVIHRFYPPFIDRLARNYGATTPRQLEIQQSACAEYIHYRTEPAAPEDPIKLVFCGGLMPRTDTHPGRLFAEQYNPETWALLLEQGFEINVYLSVLRSYGERGLEHFLELAATYPGLKLHEGVPQNELSRTICTNDFGIILSLMPSEGTWSYQEQLETSVSTKLYSYLEAGLPVIINSEYKYMAELLEREGMGLTLSHDEIPHAGEKIRSFDRAAAFENIKRFNRDRGMDKEIHRLINLYDEILP